MKRPQIAITLSATFLSTWLGISFFEFLKKYFHPGITLLESHLYTVIFGSVMATVGAYFIIRRRDELLDRSFDEIAKRKQAEEDLKHSETLLRSMIDSPQAIIIFTLDRNSRYLTFNPAHEQTMKAIWGVDIRLGMNILDAIGDESDKMKAQRNFERAFSGEHFSLTEEYGDKTLSRRFWENIYSPIYDARRQIIGLTVYVLDISERMQAAHVLEEERRKLQQAVEEIRTLRGIIPICSHCKKIRDSEGAWSQVEQYVSKHTEAKFSHGVCPACFEKEVKKIGPRG